ncbi:MAG: glutamate--tRNA ligase [Thermoproteota archaeon]
MRTSDIRNLLQKWALKNAIEHDGKASESAVLSKVVWEKPELRERIRELNPLIKEVVENVNGLSIEEQRIQLEALAPELLEKRKVVETKELPPLPKALMNKVVTRMAPEPSGHMHLGHAISFLLNYLYAKKYNGKIWLRFEDTDPRKARTRYYENFRSGCRWLGISWDFEKNNSDDIEIYYKFGRRLIEEGYAYVCSCPVTELRKLRASGTECDHRAIGKEENLDLWSRIFDLEEGEATVRLRGDMRSQNFVMRDPILFRIIDHPHALTGTKYRVWPTYDLAAAIEDSICGITHVLRSSEFALRDELQNRIRELLGLDGPIIIEYSRFGFQGTPLAKRKLRPLVDAKLVSGWDDLRMPTVEGVARRGILPEAIREFTISYMAFTFSRKEYDWELLFSVNRKILDPITKRLFFVPQPIQLKVKDSPTMIASLKNHPDKDLGKREVKVDGNFYIPKDDLRKLKRGDIIRLKDLFNIVFEDIGSDKAYAKYHSKELIEGVPKVQWVTEDNVAVDVLVPGPLYIGEEFNDESLSRVSGLAERFVLNLNVGEIIQFERFGFCRIDSKDEKPTFIFIHK